MEDSFIEEVSARRFCTVMKSELEWKKREQAVEQVLEKAAQEGILPAQWHFLYIKVLGELVNVLRLSLEEIRRLG